MRGQVTLFVIFGIIALIAIVLTITVITLINQRDPQTPRIEIQQCVENVFAQALIDTARYGLRVDLPGESPARPCRSIRSHNHIDESEITGNPAICVGLRTDYITAIPSVAAAYMRDPETYLANQNIRYGSAEVTRITTLTDRLERKLRTDIPAQCDGITQITRIEIGLGEQSTIALGYRSGTEQQNIQARLPIPLAPMRNELSAQIQQAARDPDHVFASSRPEYLFSFEPDATAMSGGMTNHVLTLATNGMVYNNQPFSIRIVLENRPPYFITTQDPLPLDCSVFDHTMFDLHDPDATNAPAISSNVEITSCDMHIDGYPVYSVTDSSGKTWEVTLT